MTIQDLGCFDELVAAIATIGTLFYLAVQIRQNTRTVEAAAFQNGVDGINHLNNFFILFHLLQHRMVNPL